jgi:hypothetical protein
MSAILSVPMNCTSNVELSISGVMEFYSAWNRFLEAEKELHWRPISLRCWAGAELWEGAMEPKSLPIFALLPRTGDSIC